MKVNNILTRIRDKKESQTSVDSHDSKGYGRKFERKNSNKI